MKVICVKNTSNGVKYKLTIGKEYKVLNYYNNRNTIIWIINEDAISGDGAYPKECFITQEEYRDKKLKELGI